MRTFFINAALIVVRVSANRISSCLGAGCAFTVGALPNKKSFFHIDLQKMAVLERCKLRGGKEMSSIRVNRK